MYNLTLQRKKQKGAGYQENFIITIDEKDVFEIGNGEEKVVSLSEGNHKIDFSYTASVPMPFVGNVGGTFNESLEILVTEDTVIEFALGQGKIEIKYNKQKIKTKKDFAQGLDNIKFGKYTLRELIYNLGIYALGIYAPFYIAVKLGVYTYNTTIVLMFYFNAALLISVPVAYYWYKKRKQQESFINKVVNKGYLISAVVYLLVTVILELTVFKNSILFAIVSVILTLVAVAIIFVREGKNSKMILIVCLVVALIFTFIMNALPKNNEEFDPNKCYWCEGEGFYITEKGGDVKKCSHCNGSGKR